MYGFHIHSELNIGSYFSCYIIFENRPGPGLLAYIYIYSLFRHTALHQYFLQQSHLLLQHLRQHQHLHQHRHLHQQLHQQRLHQQFQQSIPLCCVSEHCIIVYVCKKARTMLISKNCITRYAIQCSIHYLIFPNCGRENRAYVKRARWPVLSTTIQFLRVSLCARRCFERWPPSDAWLMSAPGIRRMSASSFFCIMLFFFLPIVYICSYSSAPTPEVAHIASLL